MLDCASMDQKFDQATLDVIYEAQRTEITEHTIYTRLAAKVGNEKNRAVLERVGREERGHYDFLAGISGRSAKPQSMIVWWYLFLARFLGVTFALKLMERGEQTAQIGYERLSHVDGVTAIIEDEKEHEAELLDLLKDERLEYAGSIVLGLSDALVELTGALAGLTLALAETRVVAMVGLITGLAASLSMAASEYLSSKSEHDSDPGKSPLKAAVFTGLAYVFTVVVLIMPYLLIGDVYIALGLTLSAAVVIIALFTGYISVAKDVAFWPRFLEMALISLGVAAISFALGWMVRQAFGIEG
jgi:VIT1/CCC1 family predicted Fe2+/Mn2+ transporter